MGLAERKTSRLLLNRPRGWSTRRQDEVVSDVWPPSLESKFSASVQAHERPLSAPAAVNGSVFLASCPHSPTCCNLISDTPEFFFFFFKSHSSLRFQVSVVARPEMLRAIGTRDEKWSRRS